MRKILLLLLLTSCSAFVEGAKVDRAGFILDPFGTLPQPTPIPSKVIETTEVIK